MVKIARDQYLNELVAHRENGRVKIITGIRRCGKSYLLFEIYKDFLLEQGVREDQIIEMALDSTDNIRYRNPFELNDYVKNRITDKNRQYYAFIDEIQFSVPVDNPYLEDSGQKITFIDTILGLMKIKNLDVYVTGSNSKMLSTDVLTQFRDRGDEIHVNPLSFAEFYAATDDKLHAWRDYVTFGGMPYVLWLNSQEKKSAYLKSLFEETYVKDVIERNDIKNDQELLEILLDFIASDIGSLTNPSRLERRFDSESKIKTTHTTISRYLGYFEEAYVIKSAKRYDIKGSRYFSTPLKYYFSDIGLRNARLNFRQVEETHIMENIIFNDLLRRGYNVDVGVVEYNQRKKIVENGEASEKKSRVQLEVDFVVNRGNNRYYIQSALSMDEPEKKARETSSLRRIDDSFKKIVIQRDDLIPWHDEKGILYLGIRDFLLNENAIDM